MEWLEARESRSKPDRGVVKLRISLINRTAWPWCPTSTRSSCSAAR